MALAGGIKTFLKTSHVCWLPPHDVSGEIPQRSQRSLCRVSPPIVSIGSDQMSYKSQDEDVESCHYRFFKPIDVDTIIWVKRHLRLLEVKGEFSARTALFEEFYLDTCTRVKS